MGTPTLAHTFLSWDPNRMRWIEARITTAYPMRLVRILLKGEWTRSWGRLDQDQAAAFWNERNSRKVLVVQFAACIRIIHQEVE